MQTHEKYSIDVKVKSTYVANQSDPALNRFVFAYTVTIHNSGSVPAQLLSRHWIITDALDKVQEVQGKGVVGEQPYLQPGVSFQYTSGAVIGTRVGTMEGSYQMQAGDGTKFEAEIPVFALSTPGTLH